MHRLLIKNCTKATFFNDGYNAVNLLQGVDILIEDHQIVRIDRGLDEKEAKEVIDATGKLVFPGLNNGYSRCLGSRISRMMAEDWNYERFDHTPLYAKIYPLLNLALEQLNDIQLETILELTVYEAANSGTTMLMEYCSPREVPIFLKLCKKYGIRAIVFPALMSRKKWPVVDGWGDYDLELGDTDEDQLLSWNERMVKETKGSLQSVAVGTGTLESTSLGLLSKAAKLARDQNTFLMTGINETRHERDTCQKRYKKTPVQAMEEAGALGKNTLLAGNVFTDHEERLLMRKYEAKAVVSPLESMLDARITPFIGFLIDDVPTFCGSGRCTQDMFRQMHALALNGKIESKSRSQMCAHDAFYAATVGVGKALELPLGQIEEGFLADIVIADIQKPEHIPFTMPVNEIVYSLQASDISDVIVDGQIIKRDGKLLHHEPNKLIEHAGKVLEILWQHARDQGEI